MAKGTHDANVYSRLMSGLQAESLTGESRISLIDKTRPVWVVTVVVPIQRENSIVGSSARLPGYSAIFDAVSGEVTDICNGCLWLDHSD